MEASPFESEPVMAIYQLGDDVPEIDPSAYVAASASVIGKVTLGPRVSVWDNVTIRGDNERITIGADSNVQEGTVMHTDMGFPLTVGRAVTIGHQAMLHGCIVGDEALIGIQAVVMNGVTIGAGCLVGAGALVTEGKQFADDTLIIGSPAKALRTLGPEDRARLQESAANYSRRGQRFKTELKKIG
jgi:carbonic anhydrase/acetyltransferase-like protein (isoleucine patch superfamily)